MARVGRFVIGICGGLIGIHTAADIVARRHKLGLTQSGFWAQVNVTQSGGSRYETGRGIPEPVKALLQIAYGTEKQAAAAVAKLRREPTEAEFLTRFL